MSTTRICQTPNCGRAVPWTGHGFCKDCIGTVLRTGSVPEIPRQPEWLRRMQEGKLPAKELAA